MNYEIIPNITDKKEFAIAVKDNKYKALLFTMLIDNVTSRQAFDRLLHPSKKEIIKEFKEGN